MKPLLSKIYASWIVGRIKRQNRNAVQLQESLLGQLVRQASNTSFGKDHRFGDINSHSDFADAVPISDYEGSKDYFDKVMAGEPDVLWKGRPKYLSKTSGTTSGSKFIPITDDSLPNHIESARNALLFYINETGNAGFVGGKMIFLQGSPELKEVNGIKSGRLSGIVAHHIPPYLLKNRMPTFDVNRIEDWESKLDAIADQTLKEDMRLISGIPPWVQMYFEVLKKKSGKSTVTEIFPNFSLLIYGGVNFIPYRKKIEELIGKKVDSIEVYPASEGFFAFQDSQREKGMLLNTNSGIFYEFVRVDEYGTSRIRRVCLRDVEINVNYAMVISSNAGLWAYDLGDTVKFVSLDPYRIIVTGRIKHFTSAFGEHVIAEEVEDAANHAGESLNVNISEFHVAPVVNPDTGELPHHEWFVEFSTDGDPGVKASLEKVLDGYLQDRNPYYRDLREGNILQQLKITLIRPGGFNDYMKSIGKLGGQNKLPRLSNDRDTAKALSNYKARGS